MYQDFIICVNVKTPSVWFHYDYGGNMDLLEFGTEYGGIVLQCFYKDRPLLCRSIGGTLVKTLINAPKTETNSVKNHVRELTEDFRMCYIPALLIYNDEQIDDKIRFEFVEDKEVSLIISKDSKIFVVNSGKKAKSILKTHFGNEEMQELLDYLGNQTDVKKGIGRLWKAEVLDNRIFPNH